MSHERTLTVVMNDGKYITFVQHIQWYKLLTYPRVLLRGSISIKERQAPIMATVSAACYVHQKKNLSHWESSPGHLRDRWVYYRGVFEV